MFLINRKVIFLELLASEIFRKSRIDTDLLLEFHVFLWSHFFVPVNENINTVDNQQHHIVCNETLVIMEYNNYNILAIPVFASRMIIM